MFVNSKKKERPSWKLDSYIEFTNPPIHVFRIFSFFITTMNTMLSPENSTGKKRGRPKGSSKKALSEKSLSAREEQAQQQAQDQEEQVELDQDQDQEHDQEQGEQEKALALIDSRKLEDDVAFEALSRAETRVGDLKNELDQLGQEMEAASEDVDTANESVQFAASELDLHRRGDGKVLKGDNLTLNLKKAQTELRVAAEKLFLVTRQFNKMQNTISIARNAHQDASAHSSATSLRYSDAVQLFLDESRKAAESKN